MAKKVIGGLLIFILVTAGIVCGIYLVRLRQEIRKQAAPSTTIYFDPSTASVSIGETVNAPLAGNIFKVNVQQGQSVNPGDVLIILEAMKMETEIKASQAGTVSTIHVKAGDTVAVGDTLLTL